MRINRNQARKRPVTPQRKLLLNIIQEAQTHLDAKELYRRAIERDPGISLATVYRNLRLFKEQGLIEERRLDETRRYYESKRPREHQHLVCRGCGHVIEFESPQIQKLIEEVERRNNFSVSKVELYLEGYCQECREGRD